MSTYPIVLVILAMFGPVGGSLNEMRWEKSETTYESMQACEKALLEREELLMGDPSFRGASLTCKTRSR